MKKKETIIQTDRDPNSKRFAQGRKVTDAEINQASKGTDSNQKSSKETKSKGNKSKK